MMTHRVQISEETLQDIINIETGLLAPLNGFMTEADFRKVVDCCTLQDGSVFTIPITLDVPMEIYAIAGSSDVLNLYLEENKVAEMQVTDKYLIGDEDLEKVFATLDVSHPGVAFEKRRSPYRVGGETKLTEQRYLEEALDPRKTKQIFAEKGWKTVVGFQTRNPIHKAHEYLQRVGLEICDGLFINPLIGWKKKGDFTQEAVMAAYRKMTEEFYPAQSVYLDGLKTQMRYAGPREAIFHALIRRNLGCTHFIIGRDHAGVGSFYGAYDAHRLAEKLMEEYELGITLLLLHEPYYCEKCGQIVTEKTCAHYATHRREVSGTIIRKYICEGEMPDETMMRREILEAIRTERQIFIEE